MEINAKPRVFFFVVRGGVLVRVEVGNDVLRAVHAEFFGGS